VFGGKALASHELLAAGMMTLASSAPMAGSAISLRGLSMTYGARDSQLVAIENLNAEINAPEFIAVVGPSGCGKSTLLKILGGILRHTSGEVRIHGELLTGPRRDISVVFQSPVLYPWRTVIDNVLLPIDVLRLGRERYLDAARELLELVGLREFDRRYPWQLSGGMQQRVAISRALINDPKLLLMDEPFGALDAMTREHLHIELQRIWLERKKTILLITHSIPEAVFLADRVLVMTARPGTFVDDVAVDLPRPRPIEIMNSAPFGEYVGRIRSRFKARGADA
jgi:NitT/TauT family transport system ATP-binding protein